jgi:3-oxoadipate CoA-transferase, alpha subunit
MATAAKRTVASVFDIVPLGSLDPEQIITPGIHVSAVVQVPRSITQAGGFKAA